jgi:Fe-S cluster assembly iron-binding protein IscA
MTIGLSKEAVRVIGSLKRQHGLGEEWGLRLRLDRAAQGAARYELALEPGPAERDRSWTVEGVPLFCDGKSYLLLGELTVHYDGEKGGFVILEHG